MKAHRANPGVNPAGRFLMAHMEPHRCLLQCASKQSRYEFVSCVCVMGKPRANRWSPTAAGSYRQRGLRPLRTYWPAAGLQASKHIPLIFPSMATDRDYLSMARLATASPVPWRPYLKNMRAFRKERISSAGERGRQLAS